MKKMRDMYAVSYLTLVDSAWKPKLKMKSFKISDLNYFVSVKTSITQMDSFEPINIQKFDSKEKFIDYMTKKSAEEWDKYEAAKQFDKYKEEIIDDIDSGVESEDGDGRLIDDDYEWVKDFYKYDVLGKNASEEDIVNRIKEIKERNAGSWETYMIMREIHGVDLIRQPNLATDENLAEVKSKWPDPESNDGLFRRVR